MMSEPTRYQDPFSGEWVVEFHLPEINPVPWKAATSTRASSFKSGELIAYQSAVSEELYHQLAESRVPLPDAPFEVEFFFWRELAQGYRGSEERKTRQKQSDATNMQKSTEDACQKIIFDNDRDVRRISSEIVEQGPDVVPGVIIRLKTYKLPRAIMAKL